MNPIAVRLALVAWLVLGCAESLSLENREWTLVELGDAGVFALAEQPLPSFRLEAGQMTGFAGCNQMSGGYELEGRHIRFGRVAATRRACPDDSNLEVRFLQALESTTGYSLTPGGLELRAGSSLVARLAPTEAR